MPTNNSIAGKKTEKTHCIGWCRMSLLCFCALGIIIGLCLEKNCTLPDEENSDGGGVNG